MSTTIHIKPSRFVRTVSSGQKPNTQFVSTMNTNLEAIKVKEWSKSLIKQAQLTINAPGNSIASPETHDAYKLSSEAMANTGTQNIFSGMAIYQIKKPSSATTSYIEGVSFDLTADKFCIGGLKVAAIFSDSEYCPTEWDMLRTGGENTTPIDGFSTLGETELIGAETVEVRGVLAETATLVSESVNRTGSFEIDTSSVTTSYDYLYLAISLFDYNGYRREYWVEGSGMIVGGSIEITYSNDFIYVPEDHNYMFLTDLIDHDDSDAFERFETQGAGLTMMRSKIFSPMAITDEKTLCLIDLFNKGMVWEYYPNSLSLDFSTENRTQSIYYPAIRTFLVGESGTIDIDCLSVWFEKRNDSSVIEYVTTVGRFFCPYNATSGEFINFNRKTGVAPIGSFNARIMCFQSNDPTSFPDFSSKEVLTASCSACLGFVDFDESDEIVKLEIKQDLSDPYVFCFILITKIHSTDSVGSAEMVCGFLPTEYDGVKNLSGFSLNDITIGD